MAAESLSGGQAVASKAQAAARSSAPRRTKADGADIRATLSKTVGSTSFVDGFFG